MQRLEIMEKAMNRKGAKKILIFNITGKSGGRGGYAD
jgi:hypothetical protein